MESEDFGSVWVERPWTTREPGVILKTMDDLTTRALTATVLDDAAIARMAFVPLGPMAGVVHKVLWQNDTSMAGVLRVEAGHQLGEHSHRWNHHHMWVLDGHATILGSQLGPGSYVHIPSGVTHDIDASASEGCTVFYLYVRQTG